MEQRKIEHITLHLIVFGTIAIIGVLARQTVLHYGWDEFSSYLILVVCSIVMGAIYLNLQIVFSQFLSSTIEKCFMKFECYSNKAVVIETPIVHSMLAESTNQPTEYEIFRANAMAEKERASQEKLDKVLSYTKQNLALYLSETDLNRLCGYITEYFLSDSLPKVEQIKVDTQLRTIDIMHFGWNIGKAFGKPRLHTATFIKKVFAHTLRDSEISTIERKMSHTESECKIKLDRKIA